MSSPFPGMDPYLEGYLWPDIHHRLSTEISRQLAYRLRPRYVARIETSTIQDKTPGTEIGILFPDVQISKGRAGRVDSPSDLVFAGTPATQTATQTINVSPALRVPMLDFEVHLTAVEIYDAANRQLVTSIEIISPYNKKQPGIEKFLAKRERLQAAGVHLIDIDLIRRGQRPVQLPAYYHAPDVDQADYLIMLTRAAASHLELWPFEVDQPFPIIPIPLRAPDVDIALDLGNVFMTIYDEAAYELDIDYSQPPPPPAFDTEMERWRAELLKEYR